MQVGFMPGVPLIFYFWIIVFPLDHKFDCSGHIFLLALQLNAPALSALCLSVYFLFPALNLMKNNKNVVSVAYVIGSLWWSARPFSI